MNPRTRHFRFIGLSSSIVGMSVLLYPLDDSLLPINQVLVALDCTLLMIWGLIVLFRVFGWEP